MNHCVPEFNIEEEDDSIPPTTITTNTSSSALKKSTAAEGEEEEEVMELVWENGQVVSHSQSQRCLKSSSLSEIIRSDVAEETTNNNNNNNNNNANHHQLHPHHQLFIQEDEMSSWLHYPLNDSDFYSDLLYAPPVLPPPLHPPPQSAQAPVAPRPPPVPPQQRHHQQQHSCHNFSLFSRPRRINESGPSISIKTAKESMVVDSNDTAKVSYVADNVGGGGGNIGCSFTGKNCEVIVSSSPVGSGASLTAAASTELRNQFTTSTVVAAVATSEEDRKRKGREADDSEGQSEDVDFESANAKKQVRGSTSTKRSRAAEVHNLSERRRRDRINEKMKALQELIPRCNKSDKASMLDEAIEYLKSLQMQVQMLSMGCGMVPMMFPGYMPQMGMGMGIGMSMDMGMNWPMMPFSPVLPGSALQNPNAASHMTPRFPMPGFHMPPVSIPDPSRIQTSQQSDLMPNSLASQNSNQTRMSNCADPYSRYLGLHQAQVPLPQNQAVQPSLSKPSNSREGGNPDDRPSG